MKIIKEGKVIFNGGKIVSIEGFTINGNMDELKDYVIDNYHFFSKKGLLGRIIMLIILIIFMTIVVACR